MGGRKRPGRKADISYEKIEEIYQMYNTKGFTLKKIADKFNCSASHIYNLLQRHNATKSTDFNPKDQDII